MCDVSDETHIIMMKSQSFQWSLKFLFDENCKFVFVRQPFACCAFAAATGTHQSSGFGIHAHAVCEKVHKHPINKFVLQQNKKEMRSNTQALFGNV